MNREQLLACLWLRWRLTKNQFARGGKLNAVISVVLLVLVLVLAASMGVGGVLGGYFGLGQAQPEGLLAAWDVVISMFLFFWLAGLMVEIQRSETIDLNKLLHLPVTLRQVFTVNFVASHFTPSILLFLPLVVGLALGLVLRSGPAFVLLLPVPLAVLFALTAWTYCLRGWLAALMINKRRRRAIVMWLTIGFVLLAQLPNLFINNRAFKRPPVMSGPQGVNPAQAARDAEQVREEFRRRLAIIHVALPPGWVGYGAMCLKQGNPWPAVGATVAAGAIGLLGLLRAYRMTIRFYTAADTGRAPRKVRAKVVKKGGALLVERTLPWLPEEIAALALATLRSLLRAPEMKMALIMPIVFTVLFASFGFRKLSHASPVWANLAPAIAVGIAVFAFANVMGNMFGLDRSGFRALVLFPTPRDQVLIGKNLALLPFVGGTALVMLVLSGIVLRFPWHAWVAGLMQVPIAFLMVCLMCNLLSIFAPYHIAPGTLQARKPKAIVFIAGFASMLVTPMVLLPAFLPSLAQAALASTGWAPWLPANVLAAAPLLIGVGWFYLVVVRIEGRLLQRREQEILNEVTKETE